MSEGSDAKAQGRRLVAARAAKGLRTAKDGAAFLRLKTPTTYQQHENGTRSLIRSVREYARGFDVSEEWLLYGRNPPDWYVEDHGIRRRASPGMVPLVGYVGAGAIAHFYATADDGLGEVSAPPGANDNTRAAEVRGDSMGPLFDRWIVFFDDVRTPVTSDLIGELCVVGLPNDQVLVKKIQRSRSPGLFHLLSNNDAPMLDQEVTWAARVTAMRPN